MSDDIAHNLKIIEQKISEICQRLNKQTAEIKLLGVSKNHSASKVDLAINAGLKYLGENKVQEALEKLANLKNKYEEFHFIGNLQKNKVKKLLSLKPTLIHSVDSFEIAQKINNELSDNKTQDILIQVNTSYEDSKNGISPKEIFSLIRQISQNCPKINIKGLMTIGTLHGNKQETIRCFSLLKNIFDDIKQKVNEKNVEMKYLSMGMSGDYEIALENGANLIRIGSLIFGNRIY